MAYITNGLEPGDQIVTTILAAPIEGMALRLNGKRPDKKPDGNSDGDPADDSRNSTETER